MNRKLGRSLNRQAKRTLSTKSQRGRLKNQKLRSRQLASRRSWFSENQESDQSSENDDLKGVQTKE